ncbi:hypothetical protein D9756_009364 [Leucocoprinus leucothites]|uniref:Protein kinase domain-containing protein n=1 Tax=Leucocoprinus leucothites TaxID=201217 RepID=A0A8H5CWM7_9AGAR|nr:hypothetical protein D9756_009364 [Leucoagaricus leucothites]
MGPSTRRPTSGIFKSTSERAHRPAAPQPPFLASKLASLTELRSSYNILREYLSTFPGEAITDTDSPAGRESASHNRFSKFNFRHIRAYTLDVADEADTRLRVHESPSPEIPGNPDDDFLVVSKAKPVRLELAKLSRDLFRLVVADIYTELTKRYFGPEAPFELHLRRQLGAQTSELYFVAGKEACAVLEQVFTDESRYRQLLAYRGEKAQALLDLMSMLVDHPVLQPESKSSMIKSIMRLSQNSFLYPQSLLVDGIKRDDVPHSAGSFGDIYRGNFRGQVVALKVVRLFRRSDLNKALKAFSREGMLWAHLDHPNILPLYGIFRLGDMHGRLAMVSPWMGRGDLLGYLHEEPGVDRILLLADIISGLQYLHDNHVVHGDLKGANILIAASGRACLADFGLSNVTLSRLGNWPLISTLLPDGGTVGWLAPELLQQDNAVPTMKSDIYALSMVCYEVFANNVPFYEVAKIPAAVILRVISGQRPTVPDRNSAAYTAFGLSEEIWGVMERGWSADPESRPALLEFLRVLSGRVDRRPRDEYGEAMPPSKFRDAMNGVYRQISIEEIAHIISWVG